MQARYDLFNKLCNLKGEIEIQIKNIVLYKNSKVFNQKMTPILSQFDIALKQVPKTISFRQDQKPVALQEFLTNFQKKVDHRKESLLNRYLREIEQIKKDFNNISKRATSKSIEFIEDTRQLEQRFKRQLSIRKHMNLQSIDSLKKHQKSEINIKEIEDQNNQIKNNEENRINQIRQNELQTLELQIKQLKQELNDELNQNNDADLIEKKKELNHQKIDFLKIQKNNEIDFIKQQISITQSEIQSVTDRISNLQQTQTEMKNSFQSIIDHLSSQSNQQTQLKILEIQKEIQSDQAKISSLAKKTSNPIVPLNQESFELKLEKELNEREAKLKFEENNKRTQWGEQIISKIYEFHSILGEIQQFELKTEKNKEKVKKENQIKIEKFKEENQKEIDEINNEFAKLRSTYSNSKENHELIQLQMKLTDINLKMNKLKQEETDFEKVKKVELFDDSNEGLGGSDFYSIFESFCYKELNDIKKIQALINNVNGYLEQHQNQIENTKNFDALKDQAESEESFDASHQSQIKNEENFDAKNQLKIEKEKYFDAQHQFLLEKIKQISLEQKFSIELKEKERYFNEINQSNENLFLIENKTENLLFSIESLINIIDELDIKIDKNEAEDKKEKEKYKTQLDQLKEKQKNEIDKLRSITIELNKLKSEFTLSLDEGQFEQLESELIFQQQKEEKETNYIISKKKEIELIKKTKNELNQVNRKNLNEIEMDDEILTFFKRKEIENYYSPFIKMLKERYHFIEELMKHNLLIKKREILIEEKEEEIICKLRSEIKNLERHVHELENSQTHLVNRKIPLPPLKDS